MRARTLAIVALTVALAASPTPAQPDATPTSAATPPSAAPEGPIVRRTERGPVTATVTLDPAAPRIGDRITLALEVVAEAGVEVLMPSFGQSLERFTIVDFAPADALDDEGRSVLSQRYTLELPMSGALTIPPLMIEFIDRRDGQRPAPEGEDAYELLTERIPFQVASVLPEDAAADLAPARGALAPLPGPSKAARWGLGIFVVLLLAGAIFGWFAWQRMRQSARRRSAWEVAHGRLAALRARTLPASAEEIDAFFVELSDIVRRYLEDRFDLHAPELTTEEFLEVASASPDLTEAHQGFLREFLRRADMVKFARFVPDAEAIRAGLEAAGQFLDQTREAGDA